ncbi:MAG TPA: hypothetical protein ENK18_05815, partial [Deltaproteobacteria bacterium]|nr:hypothetical protein [Deltaproteobacteria bacterium]
DPAASPFASGPLPADAGLGASILRPSTFGELIREQEALQTGTILDRLCLRSNGEEALGGLPRGCTLAFGGPPGKGKTRTALAALVRVAAGGQNVGLVVAEEGFRDLDGSGRDDLCSRLTKIGTSLTGLDEDAFRAQVLEHTFVIESQYHRGQTWDDFVARYRYLVEVEGIRFVVIDSLNMLDASRGRTANNLSALKTYNHEHGVTALCLGQVKDTGQPVGGEAMVHAADVVFLIEELSLTSKDMAALWGGQYRDKIDVLRAVKSVTTPTTPHLVRIVQSPSTGVIEVHPDHPEDYPLL